MIINMLLAFVVGMLWGAILLAGGTMVYALKGLGT